VPGLAEGVVGDAEGEGAGAADGGDDAELVVREVLLPVDVAGGGLGEVREAGARVVRVRPTAKSYAEIVRKWHFWYMIWHGQS
jgi:hypothetical protein